MAETGDGGGQFVSHREFARTVLDTQEELSALRERQARIETSNMHVANELAAMREAQRELKESVRDGQNQVAEAMRELAKKIDAQPRSSPDSAVALHHLADKLEKVFSGKAQLTFSQVMMFLGVVAVALVFGDAISALSILGGR